MENKTEYSQADSLETETYIDSEFLTVRLAIPATHDGRAACRAELAISATNFSPTRKTTKRPHRVCVRQT